ncbi:hypothetical protein D9M72_609640 [compost metagenome]
MIQTADEASAAIITQTMVWGPRICSPYKMPASTVRVTWRPASMAPAISKTAAIVSAVTIDIALAPTAAPTLLVTSLAPMT